MGFMDKLRLKKADPVEEGDDAAPSGPSVAGSLKGNGAAMATVLKKQNILAAAVIGALAIGAGAYYAYDLGTGGGKGEASAKIKPSSAPVPNFALPNSTAATESASSTAATASTYSTAATASTYNVPAEQPPQPAPAAPSAPAQPTPQQLAFQAAVSGQNSVVTWASASGPGAPAPAAGAPMADPATLPKPKSSVYSTHLVRKEVSPYELLQGSVIPATLETGIKSDLPGEITAVVNQPVYNSVSGAYVLIPAGSKLVGTYQSKVIAGATRVGVAWTRILFPNGTYMQIGGMPGADSSGYSGLHDEVNDHTWTVFKNALLLSLIDVGMSVASPTSGTSTTGAMTGNTALQDGEQSLAQTFGQAEAQMMQQEINIAPTLTIRPGYAFNVMVTKDLVFPGPYRHGTQIDQTAPASAAGPTIANPYGG